MSSQDFAQYQLLNDSKCDVSTSLLFAQKGSTGTTIFVNRKCRINSFVRAHQHLILFPLPKTKSLSFVNTLLAKVLRVADYLSIFTGYYHISKVISRI